MTSGRQSEPFRSGVHDLAKTGFKETQGDRFVVAVLLDEGHDILAVIWAQESHSQPMRLTS